jgi:hypothetical protein
MRVKGIRNSRRYLLLLYSTQTKWTTSIQNIALFLEDFPSDKKKNLRERSISQLSDLSFIHQWLYSPLLGPGIFFSFLIFFTHTVGLLGRGISPSKGRYLHTGQHKHTINAHTDIHALSGIRTHDSRVRESDDSSCFRLRGHCDRQLSDLPTEMLLKRLVPVNYVCTNIGYPWPIYIYIA